MSCDAASATKNMLTRRASDALLPGASSDMDVARRRANSGRTAPAIADTRTPTMSHGHSADANASSRRSPTAAFSSSAVCTAQQVRQRLR